MSLKDELTRSTPDTATLERVWAGVRTRSSPLPRRRRWWPMAVVAMGAALLMAWVHRPQPAQVEQAPAMVALADGVTGRVSPQTKVEVSAGLLALHGGGHVELNVERGPWVVTSRFLRLEVAAAELTLEGNGLTDSIVVTRGEVTVRRAGGDIVLHAGQTFSMGEEAPDWRALARAGELRAAWKELGHDGVLHAVPGAGPAEVLLLSEVAAAGGDESLACELLEQVVDAPAAGSDRGLAAYMLGRRLQTRDPEKAHAAYARAARLGVPEELRDDLERRLQR